MPITPRGLARTFSIDRCPAKFAFVIAGTAIDVEARTATLEFEDGRTKTVSVRPDIDLSLRKVGEKVAFEMTQMVALSVEKKVVQEPGTAE